jgi:DNA-binding transcriptional MerR regulator
MPRRIYIGELATRTGRTIHTVRWYEAQGLIPGVRRDSGGRRVYSELHVSWLDLIDRLRGTGMPITQVRKYVALVKHGTRTLKQRQKFLTAHRKRIEETVVEWTAALKLIDRKIDYYGEWLATGRQPLSVPKVKNLKRRGGRHRGRT